MLILLVIVVLVFFNVKLGLRVNQKYENQTLMRTFRISALFYDLQAPAEHVSD